MNIEVAAAFQIQAMALVNARAALEHVQADPVPARDTQAQADVILELSSAAQSLLGS